MIEHAAPGYLRVFAYSYDARGNKSRLGGKILAPCGFSLLFVAFVRSCPLLSALVRSYSLVFALVSTCTLL